MATNPQPARVEPAIKPIQALNRLLEIVTGYCSAQAFLAACKLGLFEKLSEGPLEAEDLARRANVHPTGCRRLLVTLAHLGLVERDGEFYRNSEFGQFCTSKSSVNLEPLSGFGEPFYHMFEYLPDALREYSPRWQQALGTTQEDIFGALYADAARLHQFARFMNAMSIPQGQVIAENYDFASHRCLMDVAGGPGGQAVQVGIKYPHLRGIVTDMAPVCKIASEFIQANGLSGRFVAVPSDLFEGPYPQGADVILLGHVLHDWNDDNCGKILRNCHSALPEKGVLLVSEKTLRPDYSGTNFALMKDLTMLVACEPDARERTQAEYDSLLAGSGFELTEVISLDAPRDLIVARKI